VRGAIRGVALVLALGVSTATSHPHAHAVKSATPTHITTIAYRSNTGLIPNKGAWFPTPAPKAVVKPHVVTAHVVAPQPIAPHLVAHSHTLSADSYDIGNSLWWTWQTDPTAYEPSASDPVRSLPMADQVTFACIRYAESRNHPNDTNQYSGAEGLYQFLPYIWQFGAKALGIPVSSANYATPEQQSAVAIWYWKRDGFSPWNGDGCV